MKVLFNTGLFGKHGIEHALVNLLLELPQEQHQYILHQIYQPDEISPLLDSIKHIVTHDCSLPRTSFWGNLHMNRKKSIWYKFVDALGLLKIHGLVANHINQHNAGVVVDYDLSLLRSARLITAPKIGIFHFRPKRFRNGGVNKLRRIGERLKHYQKLVVLCDEMYQEACYVWPHLKDKLVVIPNSINLPELIQKSQERIQLPGQITTGEYFISIARLTHQKNIHLLINSFKQSKDRGCSWKLIILGEGEDRNDLSKLITDLNLTNHVYLLGYKKNPYGYLKNAGALVLSSREEGFGLVLLEAMCLGCATISLSCPTGPTDILQNGKFGKLVPFTEKNSYELGNAMLQLSKDIELRESYTQEAGLYAENFASTHIALKFSNLLRSVASHE